LAGCTIRLGGHIVATTSTGYKQLGSWTATVECKPPSLEMVTPEAAGRSLVMLFTVLLPDSTIVGDCVVVLF
jgi:hypothetical protein